MSNIIEQRFQKGTLCEGLLTRLLGLTDNTFIQQTMTTEMVIQMLTWTEDKIEHNYSSYMRTTNSPVSFLGTRDDNIAELILHCNWYRNDRIISPTDFQLLLIYFTIQHLNSKGLYDRLQRVEGIIDQHKNRQYSALGRDLHRLGIDLYMYSVIRDYPGSDKAEETLSRQTSCRNYPSLQVNPGSIIAADSPPSTSLRFEL